LHHPDPGGRIELPQQQVFQKHSFGEILPRHCFSVKRCLYVAFSPAILIATLSLAQLLVRLGVALAFHLSNFKVACHKMDRVLLESHDLSITLRVCTCPQGVLLRIFTRSFR
jgi:hypothetical protein